MNLVLRHLWPGLLAGVAFASIHAALQWLRGGPVDPALAVLSGLAVTLAWIGPSVWVLYWANRLGGLRMTRQAGGGVRGPVMVDHLDRFTDRARRVLQHAQEEAQRLDHNYIGTEHLLLGLLREGEGVAARVLSGLGMDLNAARSSVELIISRGQPGVVGNIGLTPRAKKVIELAVEEARRLDHHYIGTEHILLGLVREGEGIAVAILESRGVPLGQLREQVLHVLNQAAAATAGPQAAPEPPSATAGGVEAQPRDVIHFHKFSAGARRVMQFANDEAQRLRHTYVGTEHVLLGLLVQQEGPAAQALGDVGVTLEQAREEVAHLTGQGEALQRHSDVGLTPRAKQLIERAVREERERGSQAVGSEHLLLGLLAVEDCMGIRTLDRLGVSSAAVRDALLRRLGSTG